MERILVPFDGSGSALRAVRFAAARCRGDRCELHVLHVEEPIEGRVRAYLSKPELETIEYSAGERILRRAREALEGEGVPYECCVRIGMIAETIAAYAEEKKCDAIVMGTRGMGAIANLVLGSVATKVIHIAGVPVTLVK
jgi:nucleotide-binding universal stress UspA family protein